jgi:hypothetical protein
MDMRWLAALVRIEERAIGSPAQDGRHSSRFQPLDFGIELKAQMRGLVVG